MREGMEQRLRYVLTTAAATMSQEDLSEAARLLRRSGYPMDQGGRVPRDEARRILSPLVTRREVVRRWKWSGQRGCSTSSVAHLVEDIDGETPRAVCRARVWTVAGTVHRKPCKSCVAWVRNTWPLMGGAEADLDGLCMLRNCGVAYR